MEVKGRYRLTRRTGEPSDFTHVVIVTRIRRDDDGVEETKEFRPRDPEGARRDLLAVVGVQLVRHVCREKLVVIIRTGVWISHENELHRDRRNGMGGKDGECVVAMQTHTSVLVSTHVRTASGDANQ